MHLNIFTLVGLFLAFYGKTYVLANPTDSKICETSRQVIISHSVLLDCPVTSIKGFRWFYNNKLLFVEDHPIGKQFQANRRLLSNYSLFFQEATLDHEGFFMCKNDSFTASSYCLYVVVAPKLSLDVNGQNVTTNLTFPANRELVAVCHAIGGKPSVNLSWDLSSNRTGSVEMRYFGRDVTSELRYTPVGKQENITCISKSPSHLDDQYLTATFDTYELPTVSISVDGQNAEKGIILVEMGAVLTLTCKVMGGIYDMQLLWTYGHEKSTTHDNIQDVQIHENVITRSRTKSVLIHPIYNEREKVSCLAVCDEPKFQVQGTITFVTYVIPSLHIFVNGEYFSGSELHLNNSDVVYVSCIANGARPSVNLSMEVNDTMMENTKKDLRINIMDNRTFDSFAHIMYQPTTASARIKCTSNSEIVQQRLSTTLYTFLTTNNQSEFSEDSKNVSVISILTVVILALAGGCIITYVYKRTGVWERLKGDREEAAYDHSLQTDAFVPHVGPIETDTNRSKIESLQIPYLSNGYTGRDSGEYQSVDEFMEDYYSEMPESCNGKSNIINQKDVCFITCLKKGKLYNRWMGTIPAQDSTRRCVFITSIPDTSSKKMIVHWDNYVKRVLELPECLNITKVEGICTDKDSLLLLHEHLDGEPLMKYMSSNSNITRLGDTKKRINQTAVGFIKDILSGLEFIHSFGFVHPGLSRQKILLTNEGTCKLYDFVLPEDSSSKVLYIKQMTECCLNQFSPEALMRNEYDQDSDKWCTGVLLWELLTDGRQPFSSNCSDGNATPQLPPDWPMQTKDGSEWTKLLFKCWCINPSDRPPVRTIRLTFQEVVGQGIDEARYSMYTS